MKPQQKTLAATGNSGLLAHNLHANPVNITMEVIVPAGVTAAGLKVQYTNTDPDGYATEALYAAAAEWFDHPYLTGLSASAIGNVAFPIRYSRLSATSVTGGSVIYRTTQAGIVGP